MKILTILLFATVALFARTGCALAQASTQTATFNLSWVDNSSGSAQEDGFNIERAPAQTGPFNVVGQAPQNTPKYADQIASDPGGTQYCYRVIAFNKAGVSPPSNVACATTPVIQVPPNAPGSITVNVTVTVTIP